MQIRQKYDGSCIDGVAHILTVERLEASQRDYSQLLWATQIWDQVPKISAKKVGHP